MLFAKRIAHLPTSPVQFLAALSITATLAFTLGVATGPVGRRIAQTPAVVDQTSQVAAVAPATSNHPVATVRSETTLVRVPYEAGWELYDGGWAGGPAFKMPALVRVPYEMGWELYDGGWAGGPNTYPKGMHGQ